MSAVDWLAPGIGLILVAVYGTTLRRTEAATPALAARVLIASSLLVTTSLAVTLAMLALPLVGRSDAVADQAHWSDEVFRRGSTSCVALSVVAVLVLAIAVLRVAGRARALARSASAATRLREQLGVAHGETVVAALPEPDAMALSSGVIVVTPSLIRALGPDERRALLAHERAHLDNSHHRYRQAAVLVAAANPLLRRLPEMVTYLTERWADEVAACATSRVTTASALARAVRLSGRRSTPSMAIMHSVATGVPERILALESEPLEMRWHRLISPVLLVAAAIVVAFVASERTLDLFQLAHALGDVARTD